MNTQFDVKKTDDIRRGVRELSVLFDISQALGQNIDLKNVLGPVLEILAGQIGILRGMLTILNRHSGEILIEEAYGFSHDQRARGRYKLGEGVTGKVVQSGKHSIVPRISEEPLFLDRTGARKKLDKKDISFICVPIKMGREVIGSLGVDLPFEEKAALGEHVRLLSIIASIIAQAVRLRQSSQEEVQKLHDENIRLQEELKSKFRPSNIVGNSTVMRNVYDLIDKVSRSNTSVLILGESGVGKELVAHAIHYNSPRAGKPFIKFNCAALPQDIVESELFGHEKGSFTGATALRKGRFELADGGTLFIDEIGDMPVSTQIKILRVLQERTFERVGGDETIGADVRIITATNRNLEEMTEKRSFRSDLYYRLNVFPILVPPLRDRKTDIPLLTDYFVEKYARNMSKDIKRISTAAIDMLMNYHWPGNVRELENCMERAVVLSSDNVIHGYHLPPTLQTAETSGTRNRGLLQSSLDAIEKEHISDALKTSGGNIAEAARSLGVTERIMGLRVKRFGIDTEHFRR